MLRFSKARTSFYDPCWIRAMVSLTMAIFILSPSQTTAQSNPSILRAFEDEVVTLVKQVEPSIVSIITQRRMEMRNGRSIWEHSVGSGVVIHVDGYILTTANVVESADNIQVSFPDGQRQDGVLMGTDRLTGIAVVKVDSVTVLPAPIGDSDMVYPGSWAIMMGNSYGVPSSVSIGLVNGIRTEDGMMQVSAFANPGSTGGAVFSTDARVIGLIAAELTDSHEQGIRTSEDGRVIEGLDMMPHPNGTVLVIPINQVKTFAEQLIKFGEVRRSWLGIEVEQSWYSIDMGDNMVGVVEEARPGLQVTNVQPGSPAEKAGLLPGDRIIAVNDNPMNNSIRLAEYVTTVPVGSKIEIRYVRDESISMTSAVLAAPPIPNSPIPGTTTLVRAPTEPKPDDNSLMMQDRTIQWLMEIDHRLRMFEQELRNTQQKQVNSP